MRRLLSRRRRPLSSSAAAAATTNDLYDSSAAVFGHLSPDQASLKDASRSYFMSRFNPLFKKMDDEDWFPEDAFPELGKQGYLGLTISPEYGGAGLDFLSAGLIAEELHYANSSLGISHSAHDNLCAHNIFLNGSEEQRRRFLPGLCDGSMIGALGMSEAGAGSDAIGSMATKAKRDSGDGSYVLNGSKLWITNGPVADVVLVYAKTTSDDNDDDASGGGGGGKRRSRNAGVSAFLVEKGTPGFSVGKKMDQKMGFRGSPQSELVFEDVKIPAQNLLGRDSEGVGIMMSGLDLERSCKVTPTNLFTQPLKLTHPSIHPSIHPNSTLATLYCPTNRGGGGVARGGGAGHGLGRGAGEKPGAVRPAHRQLPAHPRQARAHVHAAVGGAAPVLQSVGGLRRR